MIMNRKQACVTERPRGKEAFTLTELMLVIAILTILLMLVSPYFTSQIEYARRVVCRNNLRNLSLAFIADADTAGGRVKVDRWIGGRWLWDIDFDTRDRLTNVHGLSRSTLYCPSNMEQNDAELWTFGHYTVTGYWFIISRGEVIQGHPPFRFPGEGLVNRLSDAGSETAMIADATIARNGNFLSINGGWRKPHRTAHIEPGGTLPAGGNVLFADGHAIWRPFNEMHRRLDMQPEHWW